MKRLRKETIFWEIDLMLTDKSHLDTNKNVGKILGKTFVYSYS